MKNHVLVALVSILLASAAEGAEDDAVALERRANVHPYRKVEISQLLVELVTRPADDQVYTGMITSNAGLKKFEKEYGVRLGKADFDFEKRMLIFGLTEMLHTRAFQFLEERHGGGHFYVLDYYDTFDADDYLGPLEEGKKHMFLQVFEAKRIENISRIRQKDHVLGGDFRTYAGR